MKFFYAAAIAATLAVFTQTADARGVCRHCVQPVPVQVVPMVEACAYTTRWRPFLGGWVTRCQKVLVPAGTFKPAEGPKTEQ